MNQKDLFSAKSEDYAKFRPTYPKELYMYLASLTEEHALVWDCATGNGQAAIELTNFYEHVIGTDISQKQLEKAHLHPKIEYKVNSADISGLESGSADLVTVAQAFHWFIGEGFYQEVKRVLKPQGVLAVWCYELALISPEIDSVVLEFYNDTLNGYWEKERKLVEEGYRNVEIPWKEIAVPKFEMYARWNLSQLIGYLGTWSALQTYVKKNGVNPLESLHSRLSQAWEKSNPNSEGVLDVRWPLYLRAGRF